MTYLYISRLLIYDEFFRNLKQRKTIFVVCNFRWQPYLSNVNLYKFRSALTGLRVLAHRLEVETCRWHKPRAIPYPDRKCIACNKLEDELNFMLECPLYKDIRKRYIIEYFWKYPNIPKLQWRKYPVQKQTRRTARKIKRRNGHLE